MKKVLSFILILIVVLFASGCSSSETVQMDDSTEIDSLEYTIKKIEFTQKLKYSIPNGFDSVDDDKLFAIVTYTMKNVGKKGVKVWNKGEYIAVGKFVYGDGYTYENGCWDKRPIPYIFQGTDNEPIRLYSETILEPLSSEMECSVAFILPKNIVEDNSEKLFYEVSFSNKTLKYEVQNREIVEFPNIQDYLYEVEIDNSNFYEFFDYIFEPCRDLNKEETGEYLLLLVNRKYDEGLILDNRSYNIGIGCDLDFGNHLTGQGSSIEGLLQGRPWGITDPDEVGVTFDCPKQVFRFIRREFIESCEVSDPFYNGDYPIWFSTAKYTLKDGTTISNLIVGDHLY